MGNGQRYTLYQAIHPKSATSADNLKFHHITWFLNFVTLFKISEINITESERDIYDNIWEIQWAWVKEIHFNQAIYPKSATSAGNILQFPGPWPLTLCWIWKGCFCTLHGDFETNTAPLQSRSKGHGRGIYVHVQVVSFLTGNFNCWKWKIEMFKFAFALIFSIALLSYPYSGYLNAMLFTDRKWKAEISYFYDILFWVNRKVTRINEVYLCDLVHDTVSHLAAWSSDIIPPKFWPQRAYLHILARQLNIFLQFSQQKFWDLWGNSHSYWGQPHTNWG